MPDTRPQLQPEDEFEEEFRRIYDRYYRSVYYFFANQNFTEDECCELTQETFLRVYKSMKQLRRQESLRSWLREIASNVWKNEIRRRTAKKRHAAEVPLDAEKNGGLESAAPDRIEMKSTKPGPQEALLAKEEFAILLQSVKKLPPKMKRCFLLRIVQDLKYREIAEVMQLSMQTVKSHIHQARQRLLADLEQGLGDKRR